MPAKTVSRMVCTACGAVWFVTPQGDCPSCHGVVKEQQCTEDESGVVRPKVVS